MRIANPAVDTVFRYVLEDEECARTLLSLLTGESITNLSHTNRNLPVPPLSRTFFSVCFLSFGVDWECEDGTTTPGLIDVYKAQHHEDVTRFRTYYDTALSSDSLNHWTVCFLDIPIENSHSVLIALNEDVTDVLNEEPLQIDEEIIDVLPDNSMIVQPSNAQESGSTAIEKILSLFRLPETVKKPTTVSNHPEGDRTDVNPGTLEIDAKGFPDFCTPILNRLKEGAASPLLKHKIQQQEHVIPRLRELERDIAKKEHQYLAIEKAYNQAVRELAQKLGISEEDARKALE